MSRASAAFFGPNPNTSNFGLKIDSIESTWPVLCARFASDADNWSVGGFATDDADARRDNWSARTATPTTAVAFPSIDSAADVPAAVTPS